MHGVALHDLLVAQVCEAQDKYPALGLLVSDDGTYLVRGTVRFQVPYGGEETCGEYDIELEIPRDYPDTPPTAWETGGMIPETFHRFSDTGHLCLSAPVEVNRAFAHHRTLFGFVDQQVVPHLFSYSYFAKHGKMPFGELAHGANGLLDYYNAFFGQTDDLVSLAILELLARGECPELLDCPCGSLRSLGECHGPRMQELTRYYSPRDFYDELIAMLVLYQKGDRLREAIASGPKSRTPRQSLGDAPTREPGLYGHIGWAGAKASPVGRQ